jgi:hypothetical protein
MYNQMLIIALENSLLKNLNEGTDHSSSHQVEQLTSSGYRQEMRIELPLYKSRSMSSNCQCKEVRLSELSTIAV